MNPHQQEPQDTRRERTVKCFITPCLPYLISSISNNIYICDIRKSSTVLWSHIDPKYQYTQHNQIHGTNLSIPYKTVYFFIFFNFLIFYFFINFSYFFLFF